MQVYPCSSLVDMPDVCCQHGFYNTFTSTAVVITYLAISCNVVVSICDEDYQVNTVPSPANYLVFVHLCVHACSIYRPALESLIKGIKYRLASVHQDLRGKITNSTRFATLGIPLGKQQPEAKHLVLLQDCQCLLKLQCC